MRLIGVLFLNMLFETEKLIIREWQKVDLAALHDMLSCDIVCRFLNNPPQKNATDSKGFVKINNKQFNKSMRKNGFCDEGCFAVVEKESATVVGNIEMVKPYANDRVVELGYFFNRQFWGKGYASQTVAGLLEYIKLHNLASRVQIVIDVENVASCALAKKLGFEKEGVLRRFDNNNMGTERDHIMYSVLV